MSVHEIAILLAGAAGGMVGASIVWWFVVQGILHNAVLSVLVSDEAGGRWTPSTVIGAISPLAYDTIRTFVRVGVADVAISPGGPERGGRDRFAYRIKPKGRPS